MNIDGKLYTLVYGDTNAFEYCLDAFPLAKEKWLYNCFVSNGYMTLEALRMFNLKDKRCPRCGEAIPIV